MEAFWINWAWPTILIVLKIFAIIVPLLIAMAYLTYMERKVIAAMQLRKGPNVVGWFGSDDLLLSGFSFEISAEDVPAGIDLVTIIAEFDGHAVGDPAVLSN